MRTTTFARIIFAVTVLGLVCNSSCAPDTKKRTPVARGGAGGPGGAPGAGAGGPGGGAPVIAEVTKNAAACSAAASARELSVLKPKLDSMNSIGTPIKFADLPQGNYTLVKAVGNMQASNVPPNNTTFDVYKEANVSVADTQVSEDCTDLAVVGSLPGATSANIDQGRHHDIDTYFQVGPKGLSSPPLVADFRFKLAVPATDSEIGIYTIDQTKAQPTAAQIAAQNKHRAVNTPPKNRSIIAALANGLSGDSIINAAANGHVGATSNVQLFKIADYQYAIAITFNENSGNLIPVRKIVLTYGFMSIAPTTAAGKQGSTPMSTPSQVNPVAAPGAAPTDPAKKPDPNAAPAPGAAAVPAPADPNAAATPPPPGNQQPAGNQQPQQSQQELDAAMKAAQEAQFPVAPPPPAAPAPDAAQAAPPPLPATDSATPSAAAAAE